MNGKRSTILALLLAGAISACASHADYTQIKTDEDQARFLDTNYLTFDHDFTEKATADVQARADRLCRDRKQIAVQTGHACTLEMCTTNYQCMKPKDAKAYGL